MRGSIATGICRVKCAADRLLESQDASDNLVRRRNASRAQSYVSRLPLSSNEGIIRSFRTFRGITRRICIAITDRRECRARYRIIVSIIFDDWRNRRVPASVNLTKKPIVPGESLGDRRQTTVELRHRQVSNYTLLCHLADRFEMDRLGPRD